MAGQVERFVLVGIVRFLEDGDVVGAAFVEVGIVLGVGRIDFHVDDPEVLTSDFDALPMYLMSLILGLSPVSMMTSSMPESAMFLHS